MRDRSSPLRRTYSGVEVARRGYRKSSIVGAACRGSHPTRGRQARSGPPECGHPEQHGTAVVRTAKPSKPARPLKKLHDSRTTPETPGVTPSHLLCRFGGEKVGGRHRNLPQTDTRGIKDRVADGGWHQRDNGFPGACSRHLEVVDQDRVDFRHVVAELEHRVAVPVVGSNGAASNTTRSHVGELNFL